MRWIEEYSLLEHCILTGGPSFVRIYWSAAVARWLRNIFQQACSTKVALTSVEQAWSLLNQLNINPSMVSFTPPILWIKGVKTSWQKIGVAINLANKIYGRIYGISTKQYPSKGVKLLLKLLENTRIWSHEIQHDLKGVGYQHKDRQESKLVS